MDLFSRILTIAGSDSGGGAGIQADLKTITVLGAYGLSVITALTAQNTKTVAGIEAPSPEFVDLQLKTVLEDIEINACKTGMLFSKAIIEKVAARLEGTSFPLVVDPVCVAQSGANLIEDEAVKAMVEKMFPLAALLTPNIPEAERFTGLSIKSRDDIFKACEKLLQMGPNAVLIKGGHMDSVAVTDWLAVKDEHPIPLMHKRVDTKNNHGTGCTLSAAIATGLGRGIDIVTAVRNAQDYLNMALRAGFDVGEGSGPPNHLAPMIKEQRRVCVLEDMDKLAYELQCCPGLSALVPEVRMNVACALPLADSIGDVAAYSGRITSTRNGNVIVCGSAGFSASSHMAKVVLSAMKHNPSTHCAVNIAFNEKTLRAMDDAGLVDAWFDRADEPKDLKAREGSSLEWGTYHALEEHPHPMEVDAVCDRGEDGKEPMIRLLGDDLHDLKAKLYAILEHLQF